MKLHLRKEKVKKPEGKKRGPVPVIGGERIAFFPGDCLDRLERLNTLLVAAKAKPVSKSFALREGCREWIDARITEAKKAHKGTLHAKPRN